MVPYVRRSERVAFPLLDPLNKVHIHSVTPEIRSPEMHCGSSRSRSALICSVGEKKHRDALMRAILSDDAGFVISILFWHK